MTKVLEREETGEDHKIEGARRLIVLPEGRYVGDSWFKGSRRILGDYHENIRDVFKAALEGTNAHRLVMQNEGNFVVSYYALPEQEVQRIRAERKARLVG